MSTPTSLVTGVDFATVFTKGFAAAAEFYGNALLLHHRYAPKGAKP